MAGMHLHTGLRARRTGPQTEQHAAAAVLARSQVVFEPIVSVVTGSMLGAEALTRFFAPGSARSLSSEAVFNRAHADGYGVALEVLCLRAVLARRGLLPPNTLVTVNLSPCALHHLAVSDDWPDDLVGVIVEVTEQDVLEPAMFAMALAGLRERGAAVAIDDVGSGYAGLLRLAECRPDYVKIDRHIITGVRASRSQAAVLESLVTLAHRLGAAVIAEGVEDLSDLQTLDRFDVDYVQGYAIARAASRLAPIEDRVISACRAGRRQVLHDPAVLGEAAVRIRDVYALTATLAAVSDRNDLVAAIAEAAAELGVDVLAVSIIAGDNTIREIAVTGDEPNLAQYRLADYPATLAAIQHGHTLEVQIDDPTDDPAERELLQLLGQASLMLLPLIVNGQPLGMIEIAHRSPRHWSTADLTYAQGLATHLALVLQRLGRKIYPRHLIDTTTLDPSDGRATIFPG